MEEPERPDPNSRIQLLCAWAGPALAITFGVGFVLLADFLPPSNPASMSPAEVSAMYEENAASIRLGMTLCSLGMSLWLPWGISIAMQTRRMEAGRRPVATGVQVASLGVCTAIVVLSTVVWQTAAFRPGEVSEEITLTLNDLGWFVFLWPWIPFSIWLIAIAIPILQQDERHPLIYPRWLGFMSLWCAFLFMPAGLMAFFAEGPFAWHGILTFYVPVTPFFIWLAFMTVATMRAIRREQEDFVKSRSAILAVTTEETGSWT